MQLRWLTGVSKDLICDCRMDCIVSSVVFAQMWDKYNSDGSVMAGRQHRNSTLKECVSSMKSKDRILVGSNKPENIKRICFKLEEESDLIVAGDWEDFSLQAEPNSYFIQLTDLNLNDCFPSVVFNNIQEQMTNVPVIVLLEDTGEYKFYREMARPHIEVLPFSAVDDARFLSAIEAAKLKFDVLKAFI